MEKMKSGNYMVIVIVTCLVTLILERASGIIFFLGYSPVSWQSQKQKVVALFSCEAEYIAAATAAC
jgi:hypothetical protein